MKTRLDDIAACDHFETLTKLPGKPHLLSANRSGQWGMHLEEPMRLVFEPLADPMPVDENGRIDFQKVHAIRIIYIGDYHDKKNRK
ncbi:MAG: killer suppression protein [Candidatus Wallbacteria bacterium]|nr:killer suppression protein [Candidatus Wallbacteria bacterium]